MLLSPLCDASSDCRGLKVNFVDIAYLAGVRMCTTVSHCLVSAFVTSAVG